MSFTGLSSIVLSLLWFHSVTSAIFAAVLVNRFNSLKRLLSKKIQLLRIII